ncbi:MAG: thioredoxin domain-containing protein [Anaerolineales bacterium]
MNTTFEKESSRTHPDQKVSGKLIPPADQLLQLPQDGGTEFNRLVFEKSPYLLQHAANPVDWHPWGEEAFQKAKDADKPVFLSIGYSTCHWCHVMEHESFEDPQVADLLNEVFIPIKVDREERPDIDQIYMSVCQALTGSGGWPLTIILTPEKQPFFAGTYFPKESRFQRTGLLEIIPKLAELWKNKRGELLDSAEKIVDYLKQNSAPDAGELNKSTIDKAYQQLNDRFDGVQGGFGSAPKFPSAHNLTFLLRYWHQTGENHALEMAEMTLKKMRLGGIFDQVGFGFHRYSTDPFWLLPHFEKMLYDQAMLVMAYVEVFQATTKEEYAQTAREILTYVLRDMTSPEGGFYSAEDADSEGEEGLFYLWTPEEFRESLGDEGSELFINLFNLEEGGNFFDESTKSKTGRSILYLKKPLAELIKEINLPEEKLGDFWEKIRQTLYGIREKRIHPLKDDKILTDWNGLMIAAFAKAAAVLGEPQYALAAKNAADFIWDKLRDKDGRLLKRYRDGEAGLPAHLDDYAFLVWGLLELYEAVFDPEYLHRAIDLNALMLEKFWDTQNGGLFFTAEDQTDLIVRSKEIYDGAIPSGNSVAALNLLRIGRMTANPDLEDKARLIGSIFSTQVSSVPVAHTQLLSAMLFAFGPTSEVVIVGDAEATDTIAMLEALTLNYNPNKVTLFRPLGNQKPSITELAEFTESQTSIEGKATAYVCKNYTCSAPTTDINKMLTLLKNRG